MMFAIRKHWRDFLAIAGIAVIGTAIGVYILSQQNLRFPLVQEKPKQIRSSCRTLRPCSLARARRYVWRAWRSGGSPTWSSRTASRWSRSMSRRTTRT